MMEMSNELLAEMMFPGIDKTPEYYANLYPARNLKEGAMVTRYAPSPTGYQHIGSVYAAMVSERMAHQSGGIFFLRIEDTDKKREVEGAIEDTIRTLGDFGIFFDEGVTGPDSEKGEYGPYKQSLRKDIYQCFVKDLIKKGLAYPCFCTEEDMEKLRAEQEALKINTGYYGKWAKHRDMSFEDIKAELEKGTQYVIRLKSPGNPEKRFETKDMIKGKISMPENEQDVVILKSDGIPTYHFAHVIDDYLMKTTHVIRGEEWLASLPTHIQLFQVLGMKAPKYAHISTIMKMEGGSKRKLSKRKDPEISINYYREQGFPFESVEEYLVNLMNSTFEDWRKANPKESFKNFKVELGKMSHSGSLFDIVKLTDVSKNVIANMTAEKVCQLYQKWALEHDDEMAELVENNQSYATAIFNIGRESAKPRKDYGKWSDVKAAIEYFYDGFFEKLTFDESILPKNISMEDAKNILTEYRKIYSFADDKDTWFEKMKNFGVELGFAPDGKTYKKDPESYKGQVGDIATVLRIALAKRTNTPDLHDIMQIMGEDRVVSRLTW
jgi:glutamyl-tRNA synthetase